MNFLGPLIETEEGNLYLLLVYDHFSKYKAAFALPNREAKTARLTEYFCERAFQSNALRSGPTV